MSQLSTFDLNGALRTFRHVTEAIVRRWRRATTESALNELDARTLRDIGIDRSEISSMAAEWHGATPASRVRAIRYSLEAVLF